MKTSLAVLVACFGLSAHAILFGGDYVGNGGGLAEKNFLVAWENMEDYAQPCLTTDLCKLDDTQRSLLQKILAAMPQERMNPNPLIFQSEKQNPGTFILDCALKVAKTGSKIGDPIYVNTDLIYTTNSFGNSQATSVPMALAILIHEVGHHISSATHAELDLLGVRVSLVLQDRIQTTPLLPWNSQISAMIIQPTALQSFPQILLTVGDSVVNISEQFRLAVYCPRFDIPIPILPFPDLQFGRTPPDGSMFHNVHWDKTSRDGDSGDFVILGNLTNICSRLSLLVGVNSFKARIKFTVKPAGLDGKPQLDTSSISIDESYEPWYKIINLPSF